MPPYRLWATGYGLWAMAPSPQPPAQSDLVFSELYACARCGFSFEELSPRVQEILLNGSGSEEIGFKYLGERGGFQTRKHPFEGILRK